MTWSRREAAKAAGQPDGDTAVLPAVPDGPSAAAQDGELGVQLAAAAGQRWWNRWTVYLGLGALTVGAFMAGAQVERSYGDSPGAAVPGGGGLMMPGGGQRGGQRDAPGLPFSGSVPGGGGSGDAQDAAATTGTVKLVDGTTIYVQTESGDVVTIRTDDETRVQVPGALKDLKAGTKVSVEGKADGQGKVSATAVTESE